MLENVNPGPLEMTAAAIARRAHDGQKRKYTGDPYIVHPEAVANRVRFVPHTEAMLAAAWLHDVVEDCGIDTFDLYHSLAEAGVRPGLAKDVIVLVGWLTDVSKPEDGNRAARKEIDRRHTADAPADAQTIKLADLLDNTITIVRYDQDFARVYLREKALLLDVLTKGDPTMLQWARDALRTAQETLQEDHRQ